MAEKLVAQKLLIKPGKQVRFINPPLDLLALVGDLPEGASIVGDAARPEDLVPADVIVLFANGYTDLITLLPGLRTAVMPGGIVWVAYHKGTSPVKTDINRDRINAYAQSLQMQGVAMISINEDWSALRLKLA